MRLTARALEIVDLDPQGDRLQYVLERRVTAWYSCGGGARGPGRQRFLPARGVTMPTAGCDRGVTVLDGGSSLGRKRAIHQSNQASCKFFMRCVQPVALEYSPCQYPGLRIREYPMIKDLSWLKISDKYPEINSIS